VKECGLDYTQTNKGNAYLSVKSKVKNINAPPIQQGRQGNGGYFIPHYNTLRCTGLERGDSGTRTGTEERAQFKSSKMKENGARIK